MTRTHKVQWADDDDVENQKTSSSKSGSIKKPSNTKTVTKKLVQVRNYSGYAETLAIEKIVQTSPTQRKTQKFDRNLSTVHEEEDDVNESSDENV
uniref:Reverse transcriptase domain-containing protein n=1 Tax=Caenorhabditis tropicalis TaxID=1561998 RepID=A0A1I7TDB0_9PELO